MAVAVAVPRWGAARHSSRTKSYVVVKTSALRARSPLGTQSPVSRFVPHTSTFHAIIIIMPTTTGRTGSPPTPKSDHLGSIRVCLVVADHVHDGHGAGEEVAAEEGREADHCEAAVLELDGLDALALGSVGGVPEGVLVKL